jgi:hypothetical protein
MHRKEGTAPPLLVRAPLRRNLEWNLFILHIHQHYLHLIDSSTRCYFFLPPRLTGFAGLHFAMVLVLSGSKVLFCNAA